MIRIFSIFRTIIYSIMGVLFGYDSHSINRYKKGDKDGN